MNIKPTTKSDVTHHERICIHPVILFIILKKARLGFKP